MTLTSGLVEATIVGRRQEATRRAGTAAATRRTGRVVAASPFRPATTV
jgi:hypothetical protein